MGLVLVGVVVGVHNQMNSITVVVLSLVAGFTAARLSRPKSILRVVKAQRFCIHNLYSAELLHQLIVANSTRPGETPGDLTKVIMFRTIYFGSKAKQNRHRAASTKPDANRTGVDHFSLSSLCPAGRGQ